MFPSSWAVIGQTLLIALLAYAGLVATLRLFGKRTISKWNAFDMVVTVAFGSSLATVVLSKTVSLVEGLVVFALLALFQYVIARASARSSLVRRIVRSEPRLLLLDGQVLHDALMAERVGMDDLHATLRSQGFTTPADVYAAVLETDGSVSIIQEKGSGLDSMKGVEGFSGSLS